MTHSRRWQSALSVFLLPLTSLTATQWMSAIAPATAQVRVPVVTGPIGQTPPPPRATDIQTHWANSCLQVLSQQGIMPLYRDNTFRPDARVSHAEYAATVQRAFPQRPLVQKATIFRDVPNGSPDATAIRYAQQAGFWVNESRDTFAPTRAMTRSRAFAGIANGLGYVAKQPGANDFRKAFKDGRQVPDFTRTGLAAAFENRLIVNYPDVKRLNPNDDLRRGDFAAAICQANPAIAVSIPVQYVATLDKPVAVTPPASRPPSTGPVVVPIVPGTPRPTPTPPVVTPPYQIFPTEEIRGAWLTNIDSDVLMNPTILQEAMQEMARLKFNTVYPVVWNWGYTLYPSAVAKREIGHAIDPRPSGLRNRDPLAEVVRLSRQKKMTVMPWFEFGFMTTAESEIATRRPDWITQRKDGSKVWLEGQNQRLWLNPFHPQAQQFILDLVDELVTKYDVDGIQFDDHMGLPSDFGYDPYTVALYKKENNGKEPPANPKDPAWLKWRADKITAFMGRVFRTVKARKPKAIVALSPNSQKFSYENYLQDWNAWRQQGYIEELILQVYRSDMNAFVGELMQPEVQEAKRHIPVAVGILTGLRAKPVPIYQVQQQIQAARNYGFAGVSFFFYETMWNLTQEATEYRKSGFQNSFEPTVKRPSVVNGWRPTLTPSTVSSQSSVAK